MQFILHILPSYRSLTDQIQDLSLRTIALQATLPQKLEGHADLSERSIK